MRTNRIASLALAAAPVILAALAALPSQAATQWKWRDAQGQVQYSDRPPPPGVLDKDILARPSGAARAAQALPSAPPVAASAAPLPGLKASDPELEARKRKADAENCERARSYQRSLDSGMRIARTNAKGEREILDDAARAQENSRNRDTINNNCK